VLPLDELQSKCDSVILREQALLEAWQDLSTDAEHMRTLLESHTGITTQMNIEHKDVLNVLKLHAQDLDRASAHLSVLNQSAHLLELQEDGLDRAASDQRTAGAQLRCTELSAELSAERDVIQKAAADWSAADRSTQESAAAKESKLITESPNVSQSLSESKQRWSCLLPSTQVLSSKVLAALFPHVCCCLLRCLLPPFHVSAVLFPRVCCLLRCLLHSSQVLST
jgi:hypothetical protein